MILSAYFANAGVPATGLAATVRIRDLSTNALVVTDAAMTEVGDGFYKYDFVAYDSAKDYAIRADGGATLADSERYSYAGNDSYLADIEGSAVMAKEATVSAIPTNPLLTTDPRLDTLAQEGTVASIPTNTVLDNDPRLDLLTSISTDVTRILDFSSGSWAIVGTQMIFYKTDNITEIARFDLSDQNGLASNTSVFKRTVV